MTNAFLRYKDQLTHCLATYQFIEECLRFCLVRCHATIQFRLEGYLPYDPPGKAIADAALGRLIDWYKLYTTNLELISELRVIKSTRDHIAHQGLVLTFEEQANDAFLELKTKELEQAYAKADACFHELLNEMEITDEAVNRAYKKLKEVHGSASQSTRPPASALAGPLRAWPSERVGGIKLGHFTPTTRLTYHIRYIHNMVCGASRSTAKWTNRSRRSRRIFSSAMKNGRTLRQYPDRPGFD